MNTIDYREKRWGHNFFFYRPKTEGSDFHLLAFYKKTIREGDEVIWKTEYGHLVAEVVQSEWKVDPSDMYALEVRVVRRYDHENNLLWEA